VALLRGAFTYPTSLAGILTDKHDELQFVILRRFVSEINQMSEWAEFQWLTQESNEETP
jgi:hypothetical protein